MVAVALSSTIITSCNTNNDDDNVTPPSTTPTAPTFADGFGTLAAVKVKTTQTVIGVPNPIEIIMGVGSAGFYSPGNNTLVDGGTVSLSGKSLTKYQNNAYAYTPGSTDPTGIDFDADGVEWSVGGAGEVPAFTHTVNMGFPNIGNITSGSTVTKASGYTLSVQNVSNADSVIFQIGQVIVTRPANTTSYTFSSSELASLSTGTSIAQVVSYKIQPATKSGKTFYFVNETSVSKNITVE